MKHRLFILSAKAGSGGQNFQGFRSRVLQAYEGKKDEYQLEIVLTENKSHAKVAAQGFAEKYGSNGIVYACGGDGTNSEVASALCMTETPMSLIPMGTANDFAKNFDYGQFKIEDTFEPTIEPIDIIKVNDTYCINIMSLGFDI